MVQAILTRYLLASSGRRDVRSDWQRRCKTSSAKRRDTFCVPSFVSIFKVGALLASFNQALRRF